MKKTKLTSLGFGLAAAIGLALCANTAQAAISLDFANLPRTAIQFNGAASSFQLNPTSGGNQFQITGGGTGSAVLFQGNVASGPWTYGPITTVGNHQSANVTGGGVLTISDGSADLTGNVNWIEVSTTGSIGGVNAALVVNVTGITYSGTDPDLMSLATSSDGSMNLSFQFSPSKTLTDLTTGVLPYKTSYSGSISNIPVPEPTTMLAGALLLLPFGVSAIRMLRRKS
jgi:hypothetical protein